MSTYHDSSRETTGLRSWSRTRWLVIGALILAVVVAIVLIMLYTGGSSGGGGGGGGGY
jgi:ABC-type microcin C transport system permease subunit YejB